MLTAMKTLALADLYADPRRLDFLLQGGERITVVRDGRTVAEIIPTPDPAAGEAASPRRVRLPLIEGTPGNVIQPTRARLDAACLGGDDEAP